MSRKRIQIDTEKCVGCGLCAKTCQQSAIAMVEGKAKVVRDDYCDGIGNCLPVCPVGAISFSDQDIAPKPKAQAAAPTGVVSSANGASPCQGGMPSTCPGSMTASLPIKQPVRDTSQPSASPSQLRQWPVQIKLVSVEASYFDGAHLLIAADCTAYAYAGFHQDFMQGKITIIGCPKLDMIDYTDKLAAIIAQNNIQSLTVLRMEVPCCGGIERATVQALKNSGKRMPCQVKTISIAGSLLD